MKKIVKKLLGLNLVLVLALVLCPIYNVSASGEIDGETEICRAPEGSIARIGYKYTGPEEVVWSLSGAPAGVSIMQDGGLVVPGETKSGTTFTVQARDTDGNILAEKSVSIPDKLYDWVDYPERGLLDFETQIADTAPNVRMLGQANWNDYMFNFVANNTNTSAGIAMVREETVNGKSNKYVSASGRMNWSNNGATFRANATGKLTSIKNSVTVEAKVKANSSLLGTQEWSLLVTGLQNEAKNDYSYKMEDGQISVYCKLSNGVAVSPAKKLAVVEPDTWFWVREERDLVHNTYNFYINNKKVIDSEPYSEGGTFIWTGADIDDLAMYTGTKLVPTLPEQFPESFYYTDSRSEAVLTLDNAVYLGEYPFEKQVEYTGFGVTIDGDKLYAPAGESDVSIVSRNGRYNLEKEVTMHRETGIELSFDDGVTGMSGGSAVIADNKLDTTGGSAEFDLKSGNGDMLLTFDADGGLDIRLQTETGGVNLSAATAGKMTGVVIGANTLTGTYKAIYDGKLMDEGKLPEGSLVSVRIQGAVIDNLTYSSMNPTEPFVFDPVIDGIYAVGQELTADYAYYSPWNAAQKSVQVSWQASDSEQGSYSQVGSGESWTAGEALAGKWIKYTITVGDGKKTSAAVESEPVYIKDVYTVELYEGKLITEIQNSLGGSNVYAAAMLYKGGILEKTLLSKIEFSGGSETWILDSFGCDGAAVVLFYENDLKAVGTRKTVGNVPAEMVSEAAEKTEISVSDGKLYLFGDANTTASVLIYGHETDEADATICYSHVFNRSDVLETANTAEASEKLIYATGVALDTNGRAVLVLPKLSRGSYRVEFIPRSGETAEYLFMEQPEAALVPSVMNTAGFVDVLKLYSNKKDDEVAAIYNMYADISASGKNYVSKLLAGEGYDVRNFDLSATLVRYLESSKPTQNLYDILVAELENRSLAVKAIELMTHDAQPTDTGAAILSGNWTNAETLIAQAYDKAILYGIYHVKNFMESDVFLKELTDTKYLSSSAQASICNLVSGKLYSSLAALKEAVDDYAPSGDGFGGSGNSGSNGSGSGSRGGSLDSMLSKNDLVMVKNQIYTDVAENHWANEAITFLTERGIVSGRPDGSFAPETGITRAEFVKIICEAFSLSSVESVSFADINPSAWYAAYASLAGSLGIVQGSDGAFLPDQTITREDAAVLLYRTLENNGTSFEESDNSLLDQSSISDYAADSVRRLAAAGLIRGMEDGNFYPKNQLTRAQCAQIIANALRR